MTHAYNVVDADGHILEPLDLWDRYIDPKFRERRPRFVIDENGKERLSVEGKLLGNPRGIGSLGSVGVRQGDVKLDSLKYAEGRRAGSIRTPASSTWMPTGSTPPSSIRASACSPAPSRIPGSRPRCAAPTTAGSPIIAGPIPTACSGSRCCRCSRSTSRSRRCASPRRARHPRRLFAAEPVSRQEDDQRPDVRAVLDDGRGARLLDRLPRGLDQRDADRRRRPLRGGPRGAPHGLAHDGDDAGGAEP